jgi:hypothetical protein
VFYGALSARHQWPNTGGTIGVRDMSFSFPAMQKALLRIILKRLAK